MARGIPSRVDAVFVQAVIAGALSFAHLHEIAEAAGQTGWKAWAYPISVDLLLVAAWRRIRTGKAAGVSVGGPWVWFVIALAASLGANVATAGLLDLDNVPTWLRILVAGWPAVAFFGGTLLAHSTPPAPTPEHSEPVPAVEESAPVVTVDRPAASAAVPNLAAEIEPSAAPAAVASVAKPAGEVPPALVAHAKNLADAHRAKTGQPIDTPTLAARLGIPAPMAATLANQLT